MSELPFAEDDVRISFVRAAGPGGQNVNKVATAAQARIRIADCRVFDEASRQRLRASAGRRLTDADEILVIARNHRTQEGNRREALRRLTELVLAARQAPKPRRATRPTRASKERRLSGKVLAGRTKQLRGRVRGND